MGVLVRVGVTGGEGTISESMLTDPPLECAITIECVPELRSLIAHSLIAVSLCDCETGGSPTPSMVMVIDPKLELA